MPTTGMAERRPGLDRHRVSWWLNQKGKDGGFYDTDTLRKTPENKQKSFLDQIILQISFQVTSSILNIKKYVLISLHIDHVLIGQHLTGAMPANFSHGIRVLGERNGEAHALTIVANS